MKRSDCSVVRSDDWAVPLWTYTQINKSTSWQEAQDTAWMCGGCAPSRRCVNSPFKFFGLFCLVRGIFPPQFTGASWGKWILALGREKSRLLCHSLGTSTEDTHTRIESESAIHELAGINKALCWPCSVCVESSAVTWQLSGSPGHSRWLSLFLKQMPRPDFSFQACAV